MQRKERTTATSIKIPDAILQRIDFDVEDSGEFCSRTDWILTAIRFYDDYRHKIKQERMQSDSQTDYVQEHTDGIPVHNSEINNK